VVYPSEEWKITLLHLDLLLLLATNLLPECLPKEFCARAFNAVNGHDLLVVLMIVHNLVASALEHSVQQPSYG
jgi:hypothetical protein